MGWRVTRRGQVVVGLVVVALVAVIAIVVAVNQGAGPFGDQEGCTASVDGHAVALDTEQSENAALIAGIAVRRGLPARAVSIALATAYQESDLRNVLHGDRDSLGLFQQRPSQGWGTAEQVQDPVYATNAFYDALVQVDGYREMPITEAAQAVQRSGFPLAYAAHEDDARALASALTGNSPDGQFTCTVDDAPDEESDQLDRTGLTGRAATVRDELEAVFGDQALGGFAPDGVDSGHMEGSAHYEGRAIDVFFRPINAPNRRRGWAMAYYLVAQADRLHVATVIFDDMIWTARRDEEGWRGYDPGDVRGKSPQTVKVLEHRDHVHVDVHD